MLEYGLPLGETMVCSLPFDGDPLATAKQLLADPLQLERHGVATTRHMLLANKFKKAAFGYYY